MNGSAANLVVVADSHLSERDPEAGRNWSAVVAHVAAVAPDLVVHVGDISADGARRPGDLDHARDQLARIDAPVHVLPGTHDLGDNPFGAHRSDVIDAGRLDRYREVFDADRWCLEVGAWRLIGIDAQLLESGLGDEGEQWSWLDAQLADHPRPDMHLALFVHKPVTVLDRSHDDIRAPDRYLPPRSRCRLAPLVRNHRVRLVVSGHVHQGRSAMVAGVTHLWVPPTSAVLPELVQPTLGDRRCGVLSLSLADDGTFTAGCVEPLGLRQRTLDARLLERHGALPV